MESFADLSTSGDTDLGANFASWLLTSGPCRGQPYLTPDALTKVDFCAETIYVQQQQQLLQMLHRLAMLAQLKLLAAGGE